MLNLFARAGGRMLRHFWLKAIGTTVFMSLFFVAYFELLHAPQFPVIQVPLTAVDHWIGFQPAALPVYLSLWLYVSLPPALIEERAQLVSYGLVVGSLCLVGLACFYFWPNATPLPAQDWDRHFGFSLLKGIDASGNACPSLHVATAVFSGVWLHRQLRQMGAGGGLLGANALWCVGIVYSTLATKQHVFIDVLGGILLAALWLLLARPRPGAAAYPRPRPTV